ncbi:MAG TPA: DUF502 domain-containing protein [Chryseosolibacter sp.]|nr:DUF502 domain-containing protein [Chryseosolibacter sp.]
MEALAGRILRYFFSGTLFIVPLGATAYFIYTSFTWLDEQLTLPYPGLGFAIIIAFITLVGYLSTNYIFRTIGKWFDRGMNRIPFVKLIYSTVKDLLSAFVGDKKKFNKPVLVRINKDNNLYQIGFVTQSDLTELGLTDMVVVYFPHSYAFSGLHYFVAKENIRPLNIPGPAAMKFIVSGGVSGFKE